MIWKRVILQKILRKRPSTEKKKKLSIYVDERIDPVGIQRKRRRKDFKITKRRIDIARKRSRKDLDTMEQSVDAMDWISQLPEPIIHHILSFLHTEDAARTSILSKKWKQIWDSFPILDFDQRYFQAQAGEHHGFSKEQIQEIRNKKEKFRNFVDYSLQSRLEQNFNIQKFRLYMTSYDSELAPHMDRWIGFATENNVKELDIHVEVKKYRRYSLPQTVLAAKTITELSLYGCKLETCNDVQLSYLQKLYLRKLHVDGQKIQNLILSCPLIEDLRLISCSGLRKLQLSTLVKLNRVEVHLCHGLKNIDIVAPGLHTFWYFGKKSMPCEINLDTCKSLKRLTLEDANMTDELFQNQISNFPILEQLVLSKCNSLENIMILSQHLKSLALRGCKNLVEAEIYTPNLLTFEYDGDKMPFSSMIPSGLREAKLSFESIQKGKLGLCFGDDDTLWFAKLREFLAKFDRSKGLKLVIRSKKNVIIHEELSEILLPPLYDLKLEIIKSSTSIKDLVECLLRTHHPETLCIVSSSSSKFHEIIQEKIMDREEDPNCCRYYSKKCWRHYLKDVKIEKFEAAEDFRTSCWNAWLKLFPTLLCQTNSFRLKWKSD